MFKKEAVLALANTTKRCAFAQLLRILDHGIFGCLLDLIADENEDAQILALALEGINNCMNRGDKFNLKDENGVNIFAAEMENRGLTDIYNKKHSESIEELVEEEEL